MIENLLSVAPERTLASFYRTAAGAEIGLLLELGGRHGLWAIKIERSLAPKVEKGFRVALDYLQPSKAFIVYSGEDHYPKGSGIKVISLKGLVEKLAVL